MFCVSQLLQQRGNKTQINFIHPAGDAAQTLVRFVAIFSRDTEKTIAETIFLSLLKPLYVERRQWLCTAIIAQVLVHFF